MGNGEQTIHMMQLSLWGDPILATMLSHITSLEARFDFQNPKLNHWSLSQTAKHAKQLEQSQLKLNSVIRRKVINQTSLLLNLLWSTRRISVGGHPGDLFPQHPVCLLCHLESGPPLAHYGTTWFIMYLARWSYPLFTWTLVSPHFSSINLI